MPYSTHLVHLDPADTITIDRDASGMVCATVRDALGRTTHRVEFLGRLEQLDPVALAAVDRDGTEVESVTCPRCGMPTTADLCTAGVPS